VRPDVRAFSGWGRGVEKREGRKEENISLKRKKEEEI
jgi:hypothetical protein